MSVLDASGRLYKQRYLLSDMQPKKGFLHCLRWEAKATQCITSCFTLFRSPSVLLVGELLAVFVYLIITLKLSCYCQVKRSHREGSPKSMRGAAGTRPPDPEPFHQCSVRGSKHWKDDLRMCGLSSELGFLLPALPWMRFVTWRKSVLCFPVSLSSKRAFGPHRHLLPHQDGKD